MTTLQQLSSSQVSPEVPINENAETLSAAGLFGKRHPVTTGLTWGYYGGLFNSNTIADGTVALTDAADNYVVALRSTGVISTSTTSTNSLDPLYAKIYKITCAGGVVTATIDQRWDANGLLNTVAGQSNIGYLNIPQNSKSAAYTTVLADQGKHLLHPSADTTARTFTIDSNANVSYPLGTAITFVNQSSAGVMTIAITSDTMRLAGAGTTGSRTLAANGVATALKVATTEWIISGTGLS